MSLQIICTDSLANIGLRGADRAKARGSHHLGAQAQNMWLYVPHGDEEDT